MLKISGWILTQHCGTRVFDRRRSSPSSARSIISAPKATRLAAQACSLLVHLADLKKLGVFVPTPDEHDSSGQSVWAKAVRH